MTQEADAYIEASGGAAADPLAEGPAVPGLAKQFRAASLAHQDKIRRINSSHEGAQKIRGVVTREVSAMGDLAIPYETRKAIKESINRAVTAADAGVVKGVAAMTDDRYAPVARDRIMKEEVEKANKDIADSLDTAEVHLEVAKASLITEAVGKVNPRREEFARQDAQTIMNGAPSVAEGLQRLAKDTDPDIRALAAGEWGLRHLEAAGEKNPKRRHEAIVLEAVEAAREHGDPKAQKAAESFFNIGQVRRAIDAGRGYAQLSMSGFKDA